MDKADKQALLQENRVSVHKTELYSGKTQQISIHKGA
jgi:hypothetical protein